MAGILIVNDDWFIANTLSDVINEKTSVRIDIARNCSEAIALFRENTYDAIVLDLSLPVGDVSTIKGLIHKQDGGLFGLQLLKLFRSENKNILIIGYSMADEKDTREAFDKANAKFISALESPLLSILDDADLKSILHLNN